jgi:hypothetical protein
MLNYKVVQICPGQLLHSAVCLHTNQTRSYLNHLVIKHYAMMAYGGVDVRVYSHFLDLGTSWR